ncbi:MAG: acyltransferase, partial [Burkholderiaceae bacterium]|nr:acyltransferase [Burkholderiaceae bacterium]
LGGVSGGYLGVDVFFVLSGYLITGLVANGITRGDFSLKAFYWRRAKRLLPAAYLTILVTALLAPWFLNQLELKDFALQVVGAVSFTANIFLWQQTDYFQGAADLKPLLHTWSLSIEEQYYMLLPAALLLLRRSNWLPVMLVATAVSLGLCFAGAELKPIATFYLLPTRAWEMLLGSVGALWVHRQSSAGQIANLPVMRLLFYPSLMVLCLLPFFPLGRQHPGLSAVLICTATLLIVLRQHAGLEKLRVTAALAKVGDFSYSLYLVHWPLIALLKNAWVGADRQLPLGLRLAVLLLSFVSAYLLYRFVENPFRHARVNPNPKLILKAVLVSVVLMTLAPLALWLRQDSTDYLSLRRVNQGLDERCDFAERFTAKPECVSGPQPKILVWGDSYAMHLVPGLAAQAQQGNLVQATRSACGPILGLGPQRLVNVSPGPVYDQPWALRCIEFNQSVLDFIRRNQTIETVVMSSPLASYTDALNWRLLVGDGAGASSEMPSQKLVLQALLQTVAALRDAGKKVVFFAPPPTAGFDIGACLERQESGRVALGGVDGCSVPVATYQKDRAEVLALLSAAEAAGVPVIRMDPFLCSATNCQTLKDGILIYRDGGHLSHAGSKYLA